MDDSKSIMTLCLLCDSGWFITALTLSIAMSEIHLEHDVSAVSCTPFLGSLVVTVAAKNYIASANTDPCH